MFAQPAAWTCTKQTRRTATFSILTRKLRRRNIYPASEILAELRHRRYAVSIGDTAFDLKFSEVRIIPPLQAFGENKVSPFD